MRQRAQRDPTVEWMTADVADRCRAALLVLDAPLGAVTELDAAAGSLRSAADDLLSVVELLRGKGAAVRAPIESEQLDSFDLSFGSALGSMQD